MHRAKAAIVFISLYQSRNNGAVTSVSECAIILNTKNYEEVGSIKYLKDEKTGHDKAELILHALRATISIQPQSLRTEILKRNDALKVIAEKMDLELSLHSYID